MSAKILIVDDEQHARDNIGEFLESEGYEFAGAATLAEARKAIEQGNADIILLDVQLPDGYGPSLLEETMHMLDRPPIIMITAYGEIDMAVEAMKNGAHDFLQKPIEFSRLKHSIERAGRQVALRRELEHYRETRRKNLDFVIGSSPAMLSVVEQAERVAETGTAVLLTGPTGTGKEVLANAIHQMGARSNQAIIGINCAAIQATVLESELFGHERGAFTGADKRKPGLMELADGGVLFLDEVSLMPLEVQPKLLRALEEKTFFRVGGTKPIHVDAQIIAATNRDLEQMIASGEFRADLYYRLKVVELRLPPLSDRRQDIPELVGRFIRTFNPRLHKNISGVTDRAMEALTNYDWPGNIRELRNTIERAMIFCDEPTIGLAHLPENIGRIPA